MKLVLAGSHITAMKRLSRADQPLFGRCTSMLRVGPLGYRDVAEFVPSYAARDRIAVYGIFGGLPGHLVLLDPDLSLAENVIGQILNPAAPLHDEAVHTLDAFLGEAEVHYSVVEAIANGETRWYKISNRVGKKSASLSRPINWLGEMEIVEQIAPITEYPDPSPKSMVYRLGDPYLQFWHTFISELRARGAPAVLAPEQVWEELIVPRLGDYLGRHVLERVCREFVVLANHPALPFRPHHVGQWWSDEAEVDVVALGPEGEVLIGECKWGTVNRGDLDKLESRAEEIIPALPGVRSVTLALFSGEEPTDPSLRERVRSGQVLHFSLEDLFAR